MEILGKMIADRLRAFPGSFARRSARVPYYGQISGRVQAYASIVHCEPRVGPFRVP